MEKTNVDLECPSCKKRKWIEIDEGYYCENCEYTGIEKKHQIDKKLHRQDNNLSTRLPYVKKEIKGLFFHDVHKV